MSSHDLPILQTFRDLMRDADEEARITRPAPANVPFEALPRARPSIPNILRGVGTALQGVGAFAAGLSPVAETRAQVPNMLAQLSAAAKDLQLQQARRRVNQLVAFGDQMAAAGRFDEARRAYGQAESEAGAFSPEFAALLNQRSKDVAAKQEQARTSQLAAPLLGANPVLQSFVKAGVPLSQAIPLEAAARPVPSQVHYDPQSGKIISFNPRTNQATELELSLPRNATTTSLGEGRLLVLPPPGGKPLGQLPPQGAKTVPGLNGWIIETGEGGIRLSPEDASALTRTKVDLKGRQFYHQFTSIEIDAARQVRLKDSIRVQVEALTEKDKSLLATIPWAANPLTDKSVTPLDKDTLQPLNSLTPVEVFKRDPAYLNDRQMGQLQDIQSQQRLADAAKFAVSRVLVESPGATLANAAILVVQRGILGGSEATAMFDAIMGPGRLQLARAFQGAASQLSNLDVNAVREGLPKQTDKLDTALVKLEVIGFLFRNQQNAILGKPFQRLEDTPELKRRFLQVVTPEGSVRRRPIP